MSFATLMYHEIRESTMLHPDQACPIEVRQNYADNLPPPLFVTLENFQTQMDYLYKNNYHTLTLAEVIHYYYTGESLPEKSILLTFDDCYQSVKQYAYPILKKYQFHGVAFVVTGWLNTKLKPFQPDKSVCLTEEELVEMSDVFEYANHTDQFHTRTGTAVSMMMEADDYDFLEDLNRCNENPIINQKEVFAYPFGLFSERNVSLLRKNGYKLAFTSDPGKNHSDTDPLRLKRNAIPYFMDIDAFQDIVD